MITYAENDFSRYLFKSAFLHLFIFLIIYLFSIFIFKSRTFKTHEIRVLKASIRVDVVGMPTHTLKELRWVELNKRAEIEEAADQAVEAVEDQGGDESVVYEKVQKRKSFLSTLKKLSKKEIADKRKGKEKITGKRLTQKEIDRLILAGNVISKGTSLTGGDSAQELSDFGVYIARLPDLVKPYWKLPSYLLELDLRCRVQVFLSKKGDLLRTNVIESSGYEEYDTKALNAIKDASPFPEPPETIGARILNGDIVLGFPL